MKKMLVLLLLCLSAHVSAEVFATQSNTAGGKIVLTDELCKHNGKTYDKLNKSYTSLTAGYNTEGCWFVEDETIVIIWLDKGERMRYPIENFTINKNYKSKSKSYM